MMDVSLTNEVYYALPQLAVKLSKAIQMYTGTSYIHFRFS